eukprot:Sspe_Gene.77450::Locus_48403_Transcript_1_1_Confidence_1.000_Length_386::g.77450::m.77450
MHGQSCAAVMPSLLAGPPPPVLTGNWLSSDGAQLVVRSYTVQRTFSGATHDLLIEPCGNSVRLGRYELSMERSTENRLVWFAADVPGAQIIVWNRIHDSVPAGWSRMQT